MQPPTEPTTAGPHDNVDELYRRYHRDLQHAVASAVRAPNELIEDACQTAWAIMLRARPGGGWIFPWLRAVAIHEAYRLMAIDRRQLRLQSVLSRGRDQGQLVDQRSLDEAVNARETLRWLASLPERQRTDLALKAAGYSYKEIRARTPARTMTSVNKSLVSARARIGCWRRG